MSYAIRYAIEIVYIPAGAGPMSVPSAQKLKLGTLEFSGLTIPTPPTGQAIGTVAVPGGEAPTQANFRTALQGSSGAPTAGGMTADLDTAIAANLTQIQNFASGGG